MARVEELKKLIAELRESGAESVDIAEKNTRVAQNQKSIMMNMSQ